MKKFFGFATQSRESLSSASRVDFKLVSNKTFQVI